MHVLTIYNHGTTVDSNNTNHTITKLTNSTSDVANRFFTQGVGSELKDGGSMGGAVFGAGVKDNVTSAVTWVEQRYAALGGGVGHNYLLNLCGFSRGAVTCFMQANRLHRKGSSAEIKNIRVRIFAIDPVPGCCGAPNSHMYKHIELTPNVKDCRIILAETERRSGFRPVVHNDFFDDNKKLTHTFDSMPGNHAGIVNKTASRTDSYKIVKDMAKRFLNECPRRYFPGKLTRFDDETFMTEEEILGRYSQIMMDFNEYIKMGNFTADTSAYGGGSTENVTGGLGGMDKGRVIQMQKNHPTGGATFTMHKDRWKTGMKLKYKKFGKTSRFFTNQDHAARFRLKFPMAYTLLRQIEGGNHAGLDSFANANSQPSQELANFLQSVDGQKVSNHLTLYLMAVSRLG